MAWNTLSSLTTLSKNILSYIAGPLSSSDPSPSLATTAAEEVEALDRTVRWIRALLTDAEERAIRDKYVKFWLFELKQIAYDAEHILGDFDYELMRVEKDSSPLTGASKEACEVRDSTPSPLPDASFLSYMIARIKIVRERLDDITKDRAALQLREEDGVRRVEINARRDTTSLMDRSAIYGRECERNEIVTAILSGEGPCDQSISVVSVVAMGGMGKTTLAQLVYNDERVTDHFKLRSWVWVSDVYDEVRLTRAILESVTDRSCDLAHLDLLQNRLRAAVSGKRILLVLDDVWNEDPIRWGTVRAPLVSASKGSHVIITTRNKKVASIMGTRLTLHLDGLPEDDSWKLFCHHAFTSSNSDSRASFEPIAVEIVKKCRGLPLLIRTLGGLLSSERSEDSWDDILRSEVWDSDQGRRMMSVLELSYHHLPAPLKPCFAYCAVFPKGHLFEIETLVRMWMAHGLIQTEGTQQMEEIGKEYARGLVERSFFQNPSHIRSECYFRMHDHIHDLAKSIAERESFRAEPASSPDVTCDRYVRHVSVIIRDTRFRTLSRTHKRAALRSLFLAVEKQIVFYLVRDFFGKPLLQYLRLLDFSGSGVPELPNSIGEVKQLRYLGLRGTYVKKLPESLCSLYNLQTLDMRDCGRLSELPNTIGELRRLRYLGLRGTKIDKLPESVCSLCNLQTLDLRDCERLAKLPMNIGNLINLRHLDLSDLSKDLRGERIMIPAGIRRLTRLQTLQPFVASQHKEHAGMAELKHLNDLRGKLSIVDLHNLIDETGAEAREADLRSKSNLTELVLKWNSPMSSVAPCIASDGKMLLGLQPHTNIQSLEIEGYRGSVFPAWVGDPSFSRIVNLQLVNCSNCGRLPPLWRLPSLKRLLLQNLTSLEYVGSLRLGNEEMVFPSLETLRLERLPNLTTFGDLLLISTGDREIFPSLRELGILQCPKITSITVFNLNALKKLQIYCCPNLVSTRGLHVLNKYFFRTDFIGPKPPGVLEFVDIEECFSLPQEFGTCGDKRMYKIGRFRTNDGWTSSSLVHHKEIYGREPEKDMIVRAMLSGEGPRDDQSVSVVSIAAMGGMGKTTLAKLVCNHYSLISHFELRSWVWVSPVDDERTLTRAIVESLTDWRCDLAQLELDVLQNILRRVISGKRFLLVLDDMRDDDRIRWDTVRAALVRGSKGSRVMITTRSEKVASTMGTRLTLCLAGLSEVDSWQLFCHHAFTSSSWDARARLEPIGEEIVKKCRGSPLMIRTLGGLLSSERSEASWDDILRSVVWDSDEGGRIMSVLKLGYDRLPAPLKLCFAYCAVLPKGHRFEMEALVRMWIDHGLIQPESTQQMEEIGKEYVRGLVERSFFQRCSSLENSSLQILTMHEHIHDLAISIAEVDRRTQT